MKKKIFISILFLSIFILKTELFSNEFIHKNPYKKTETFYNKPNRTKDNFVNISVTKLTPTPIEGTLEENYIILKPREKPSLKFFAVTSLHNLFPSKENKIKNFKQENFLPITLVHGNIQIEKNKIKKNVYLLGVNEETNNIEKIYSYSIDSLAEPIPMEFNITLDKRFKNTFLNLAGKGTDLPENLKDPEYDYSKMMTCEGPTGTNNLVTVQSIYGGSELKALDNFEFYNLKNNHLMAYSTVSSPEDEYIKHSIFFKADGSIDSCDVILDNGRKIHLNIHYINQDDYIGSATVNLSKAPRSSYFTFPESNKCFKDESFNSKIIEGSDIYITLEHLKGYLPQCKNLKINHIKVNDNGITYILKKSKYGELGIFAINCFENSFRIGTGRDLVEFKHHIVYEYFYNEVSLGIFTLDLIQNGPPAPPIYPVGSGNIDLSLGLPHTTYIFNEPKKEILKDTTIHSNGIIDITNFNGKFANVHGVEGEKENIVDTMISGLNGETTQTVYNNSIYENDKISIGFNEHGLLKVYKKDTKKIYDDKLFLKFRYSGITLGELTFHISNHLPMDFSGEGDLNLEPCIPGTAYIFPKNEKDYSGETVPSSGILTLENTKGFLPHLYGLGKNNIIDFMKISLNGEEEKTISGTFYENDNYSIGLNSEGQMEVTKKKFGIYKDTLKIKYLYKNILIGTFTLHLTNLYKDDCNFEIIPSKVPDSNYTFNSNGKQLTGDKSFKLTGNKVPLGNPIDKFKIESSLGTQEKTLEEGKDNLLAFNVNGNIFKIGFDKNKNFKILLTKVSDGNLNFSFKLTGTYKDILFEDFNFVLKRNPLRHTVEQLNIVLNETSEYLLSNKNQNILLGKDLKPDTKDSNTEEKTIGTGTFIDTDFSPKAYLRKLKFKDKEYDVTYDPKEDAYITEQIDIAPNFKSSFYLNSTRGVLGFKNNLQWNGEEVKGELTYLEYNSLGEIITEHLISLNIKKFIPKTNSIEILIPSGITVPFEVFIDNKGQPSNKRITINQQGQVPYLNPSDSKVYCTFQEKESTLDIKNPLFSYKESNKDYTLGYKNSKLYLKINSVKLTTSLEETISLSQDINNSLNGTPVHRADYKIILKRKPTFVSIEGDTMEFGDMISHGGIYYGKSKVILTNTENRVLKTKVLNPQCFLTNEHDPEDKLPLRDINVTDVLNTSLNTSIFYVQGTVNVSDQGPGNYRGNILLELTLN